MSCYTTVDIPQSPALAVDLIDSSGFVGFGTSGGKIELGFDRAIGFQQIHPNQTGNFPYASTRIVAQQQGQSIALSVLESSHNRQNTLLIGVTEYQQSWVEGQASEDFTAPSQFYPTMQKTGSMRRDIYWRNLKGMTLRFVDISTARNSNSMLRLVPFVDHELTQLRDPHDTPNKQAVVDLPDDLQRAIKCLSESYHGSRILSKLPQTGPSS